MAYLLRPRMHFYSGIIVVNKGRNLLRGECDYYEKGPKV